MTSVGQTVFHVRIWSSIQERSNVYFSESLVIDTNLFSKLYGALERENRYFVLDCLCILAGSETAGDEPIPTWPGCHSVMKDSNPSVTQVDFLPFLPFPLTNDGLVYIALKNVFSAIAEISSSSMRWRSL